MTTKRKAAKSSGKAAKKSAGKKSASKGASRSAERRALTLAMSPQQDVGARVAAMAVAPLAVCESDKDLQAMLAVLRNQAEPSEVRLAALQALQAASFSVIAFESCRGDYTAALRAVATDPDAELRQRVLGLLAREQDGFAQKKLLEGLKNPEKALVPPEKALQLLSYDVHAEAYTAARDIVNRPPNSAAKREALRLLAADATSAPIFEKVLRDKDEAPELRQIAASALHSLKPEKLQEYARAIVLDKSEQDEIRATSLTALAQFGDDAAIANDDALLKGIDRLSGEAPTKLKQGARRFLSKYGR